MGQIRGSGPLCGLWREFRERCYPGWRMTRLRSRAKPARPCIWRLIILIRFTLPSTAAGLWGRVSPGPGDDLRLAFGPIWSGQMTTWHRCGWLAVDLGIVV